MTVVQGNGPNGTLATLYFDDSIGPAGAHGAPRPVADRPRADAGGLRRLSRRRRHQVPFRWTFAWLDGRDHFEFSDVKLNVPIDAAKFGAAGRHRGGAAVGTMSRSLALDARLLQRALRCLRGAGARAPTRVDAAFASFFQARTSPEAAAAAAQIVASGVGFDEASARLRLGRDLFARRAARRRPGELPQRQRRVLLHAATCRTPTTPVASTRCACSCTAASGVSKTAAPRDAGRGGAAGRRRADLRHAVRVARRAVVERPAGGEPARDPRSGEAHLQRRREPRRAVRRLRRRNRRVLHRRCGTRRRSRASCR